MKIKRSKERLDIIVPVLLGIFLPCFFYFHFWGKEDSKGSLPGAVQISNQSLPNSRLLDLKNEVDFSEKIRNGKVLLIFLSSKCNACKKDVEIISKLYPEISSKVQIYGISIENQETMLNFVNEKQIQFSILTDGNAELFKKLQIRYFPTKFLVEDGVITKTFFGNFPNEQKLFEDLEIGN